MFIDWTCVYDDGTRPFADDVPRDQRRPLRFPIGEDVTIRVALVNAAGAPVVLASGDILTLTARSTDGRRRRLFAKAAARATPANGNRWTVAIAANDTRSLKPQPGIFDLVAVILATGRSSTVVPASGLELQAAAAL